jgi:hypothetical protein
MLTSQLRQPAYGGESARETVIATSVAAVVSLPPPTPRPTFIPASASAAIGDYIANAPGCTYGGSAGGPEQTTLARRWNRSQSADAPCFTLIRPGLGIFDYLPFLFECKVVA